MYKCKYCEKEYTDKGNLRKHEKNIHEQPQEKVPCPYCNKLITPGGTFTQHERTCRSNPERQWTERQLASIPKINSTEPGECSFCGRYCKNQNSLRNHQRVCKQNPDRQVTIMESLEWQQEMRSRINYDKVWNKGKTHLEDSRIPHGEICRQRVLHSIERIRAEGRKPGNGKTEEKEQQRRENISRGIKKAINCGGIRHGSGRGKKGWYKEFFCDSTYELVFIIYNIDNNIKFKRCDRVYTYVYKNETHKYYPDFELEDGSLVETKGYHTELVDIKKSAVTDRQIKILYEKDLKYAFDWVKEHYTYKQLSDLYE